MGGYVRLHCDKKTMLTEAIRINAPVRKDTLVYAIPEDDLAQ